MLTIKLFLILVSNKPFYSAAALLAMQRAVACISHGNSVRPSVCPSVTTKRKRVGSFPGIKTAYMYYSTARKRAGPFPVCSSKYNV